MKFNRILDKKPISLNFISLKAKLIIAILSITLGCALFIGFQALRNGQQAHNHGLEKQLVTLREAQSNAFRIWVDNMESQVSAVASAPTVVRAMNEFSAAYHRLEMESFDSAVDNSLEQYYKNRLLTIFNGLKTDDLEINRFLPKTRSGQLLQYDYISNSSSTKDKSSITSANSKRYYDGVHAYYHDSFRKITEKFGFNDMYLINLADGAVVYSVGKKLDYATRLISGAYEATPLGHLFNELKMSQIPGNISVSDFGFYVPNENRPTAFMGTTLFNENQLAVGVLVFSINPGAIDQILQQQEKISAEIGKTTETLIIGNDRHLRSNVNFIHGLPDEDNRISGCYARALQKLKKLDVETANRICLSQSASLLQTVNNDSVTKALDKETGIGEYKNYMNEDVIIAYAPLRFGKMNWVINTQILASEAHEPIHGFQRNLLVSIILIICAVTFLSMLIAYLFVNPVSKLTLAAKKLSRGETDIQVETGELDEYGELGKALQLTGQNLEKQHERLENAQSENRKLLRNTLPDRVIKHHLAGEQDYLEQMTNTAVLYLILEQPVTSSVPVPPAGSTLMNQAMEHLYQIAAKNGAEYIRVVGGQLITGFGFKRSRMDYTNRCLQCAKQLHQEVRHFNHQHRADLVQRIGVHSAPLTASIIYTGNDRHFSYDLIGPALDGARNLASSASGGDILLSDDSYRQIPENQGNDFENTPVVLGEQKQSVWSYIADDPDKVSDKAISKPQPVNV